MNHAGFDVSNMEAPDKDIIQEVTQKTGADYVVAMEVAQLNSSKHVSFFQIKVETRSKLRYVFYNVKRDKFVSFQVAGDSENKSVFGGVGHKDPLTKALIEAMGKANEKIAGSY